MTDLHGGARQGAEVSDRVAGSCCCAFVACKAAEGHVTHAARAVVAKPMLTLERLPWACWQQSRALGSANSLLVGNSTLCHLHLWNRVVERTRGYDWFNECAELYRKV
jgi:hypothetical protein